MCIGDAEGFIFKFDVIMRDHTVLTVERTDVRAARATSKK